MSQGCINCTNQPSDNGSLGGAGHEDAVTPMVIGIIIGTVAVFILLVCALFYCVKLENNRYMAKLGDSGEEGQDGGGQAESCKSRPSSVTVALPAPVSRGAVRELQRSAAVGARVGGEGKRSLFGWGRKSALPIDNTPAVAIEMV